MNKRFFLLCVASLLVAAQSAMADIRIGVAGPMTGPFAGFGQQMREGAEKAIADINARGGIDGELLRLSVADDACDPEQAIEVARRFAADGIEFVAGHFCSGASIPASSVYAEGSIIMITPASANPKFTDQRPARGVYRVCGRDDKQGEVAAEYLADTYGKGRIAVVHDRSDYGSGLAEATIAYLDRLDIEPVLQEEYAAGEQDYSALVTRLRRADIDVLYVGGYHTEAGLIVRQMRDQGMDTALVSGDALTSVDYWSIAGDAGEGTVMTLGPDPRDNEHARQIVEEFRRDGVEPEGFVLKTYEAIQVWSQAAEMTDDPRDYDAMADTLDSGTFSTILGEVTFDEVGDALPAYVLYVWKNGQYGYL